VPTLLDVVMLPGAAILRAMPGDRSLGSALAAEGLASFGATGPPPAAAAEAPARSTDDRHAPALPQASSSTPAEASPPASSPSLPTTIAIDRATLETIVAAIRQLQELYLLNAVITAQGGFTHEA